jgi:hypothetical protein
MYALKRVLSLAALVAGAAVALGIFVALVGGVAIGQAVAWSLVVAGLMLAVYPVFMFSGARPRLPLGMEPTYVREGLPRPRRESRGADMLGTVATGLLVAAVGIALLVALG